jgi:translocation and assembly module TamB
MEGITPTQETQVKKQLSEALELSVSSTVGGSITQRQSMNLNYNIKKNITLRQ